MTVRMLIDARHREETRVAVVKGNRIDEFDFESAERKQLKGNIYLAKVTRVEPSLQAAFVDYGGNRHGFLAFAEIHPDYYQIPKEDRDALLREEAEHAAEEEALRSAQVDADDGEDGYEDSENTGDYDDAEDFGRDEEESASDEETGEAAPKRDDDSAEEDLRRRRQALRRRYKIQDVIHRRQVLLVQVVKEERGNKGAALTTYLSLAGRYCVLMPNTTSGGGISRKISNAADRKRLKSILADLALPTSMGCIVRTAGLQRTKAEIRRDFDYLARLWDGIRETTLKSQAPTLIHQDSDLIKRAIRDIYNKDIDEVIVEGEEGYGQARNFMKLLMPSHVKRVKAYADPVPLFQRFGAEDQLAAMYNPVVQLKSGGYLVINPTEALVSIDINSGRSTREHGIEQTAVSTNLEAAQEIARQLRLRDMAGLVVIDFIDMEHGSNVRKVEKAMRAAVSDDRARIQVGRISQFGLLEMSRQRLRTGVLEASTRTCPHCEGTGLVRTASSAALSALRLIEEEAARGRGSRISLRASQEAAFYILNNKRAELAEMEARFGVTIEVLSDGEIEGARMSVEASGPPPAFQPKYEPIVEPEDDDDDIVEDSDEDEDEEEREPRDEGEREERGERGDRTRSRRRRGRGRRREGEPREPSGESSGEEVDGEAVERAERPERPAQERDEQGEGGRRRKRRGRRGGKRRREEGEGGEPISGEPIAADGDVEAAAPETDAPMPEPVAEKPKRVRRTKAAAAETVAAVEAPTESVEAEAEPAAKPKRTRRKAVAEAGTDPVVAEAAGEASPEEKPKRPRARKAAKADTAPDAANDAEAEEEGNPRRGWWQRTFGNEGTS